ncbi:MAG: DMT family transporter [Gammaproteobacteria bacterium]|nr:DMT family transporter [Gammaproteobacteria bacterium]MBU1646830.1 DMT family transporter [Gammaproteobacteria bacterium]MBU1971665.1 DMT family transporter [Gammaproteobacteria bacterium]
MVAGATVWGLIWYPYRVLEAAGLSGLRATALTYVVALALGVLVLASRRVCERPSWWLLAVGVSAAGCNVGYVLGMLHGEVMRVLLLFYLAPLWTVLLARLLLGERAGRGGAMVIALAVAGAMVMLWQPRLGLPLPENMAEWLGLGAGFLFAMQNVLIRRTPQHSIELKSTAVFFCTLTLALVATAFEPPASLAGLETMHWLLVLLVGVVLLAINLVVQFGLTHVSANRAIIIFMFELAVAAVSAWLLAGETMGLKEWLGGAMIVAASAVSARQGASGSTERYRA